ncbi:MAG: hypothetical protein HYX69_20845 [Planctomycetia bacterium]|nr:hypothetical protein [Planctomycetia bacterium]
MSIGPSLPATSAAATPLAQAGADLDRLRQAAAAQARQVRYEAKADSASGVATPDGDQNVAHERDADGRSPWEAQAPPQAAEVARDNRRRTGPDDDPSDESGRQLDVTA